MWDVVTITFETPSPSRLSAVREWAQIFTPFVAIIAVVLTVNWNDRKNRATELLKRLCTSIDEIEKATDALLRLVELHLTTAPKDDADLIADRVRISCDFHRLYDQVTVLNSHFDRKTQYRLEDGLKRLYPAVFDEPFGNTTSVTVDAASARIRMVRVVKTEWLTVLHGLRRGCLMRTINLAPPPIW